MNIAILDPTTLTGEELRQGLAQRKGVADRIALLTTEPDEADALTESAGEPALVRLLGAAALQGIDLIFVCGSIETARSALAGAEAGATVILLSVDADVDDGIPVVAGINDERIHPGATILSPAPTVIAVAHLLHPLRDLNPTEAVATAIQPASTRGNAGLDELLDQTRKLLTFQQREKSSLFGGQMAFNILPAVAPRLTEQLASVVDAPQDLALTILQGSVFHSLSVSLYVRFSHDPGIDAVRDALRAAAVLELVDEASSLGPIDAAARDEILVGEVIPNLSPAAGYWIWATMDNLTRGGALNALEIAERLHQD